MIPAIMPSPEFLIRPVVCIASVGVCVSAAEEMRRIDLFSNTGLLSWSVLKFTRPAAMFPAIQRLVDGLFAPGIFAGVLLMKLVTAACLAMSVLFYPDRFVISGVLAGLVLANLLLLKRRTTYGLDGSDHMNIVIFLGATFFFLSPSGSVASTVSILYIGLQAVLSYGVSGLAKAAGSDWRSGRALAGIFSTKIYGHWPTGRFFRSHPRFGLFACWGIIIFQCLFATVLVVDDRSMLIILLLGALFHVSTAFLMGLNSFMFSFIAAYPAIIYLRDWLWR